MSIKNWFAHLTGIRRLPVPGPLTLFTRDGDCVLDIRNQQQMDGYSCAAVSGSIVLDALNPGRNFDKFYKMVDPDPDEGTADYKLVKALRRFGIRCSYIQEIEDFDYVEWHIGKGRLIMASIHLGDDIHHWVVIYGYGIKPKSVFLAGTSQFYTAGRVQWGKFIRAHRASVGAICCSAKR